MENEIKDSFRMFWNSLSERELSNCWSVTFHKFNADRLWRGSDEKTELENLRGKCLCACVQECVVCVCVSVKREKERKR